MALISCPECGKEISDAARSCPHCGVQDFELRAIAGALGVTTDWLLEAEEK